MFEEKETITLEEYKAWLVGLIRGKKGMLPDLEDWKQIKKMLDKIAPEKETIYVEKGPSNPPTPEPFPSPYIPYEPYHPPYGPGWTPKDFIWTSDGTDNTQMTISGLSSSSNAVITDQYDDKQLELIFEDWTK